MTWVTHHLNIGLIFTGQDNKNDGIVVLEKKGRKIRLKIKEIIDELSTDSIKAFILQYASQDKAFEMAFKSHFISRVQTGADESLKYKRVLEEMIKPKNAHNKIGPSQKKMISIVLKDFVLQMNDCLSTDNYTEAYFLIKESLEKIAYLQNRYNIRDVSIENCRLQFINGLDLILDKQLAPAFRNRVETELKSIVSKSYYIPRKHNLIELLNAKNVLVREDKTNLFKLLLKKSEDKSVEEDLLITIIQLSHPFPEMARSTLLHFDHDKILNAIKYLIKDGKFEFVDFFIDNPEVDFKHNKSILNILKFVEKEDHEELNRQIKEIKHEELNILDLQMMCDALPAIYLRKEFSAISSWIMNLPFAQKVQLVSNANKNDMLLKLLEEKSDIEWIKVYDTTLLERGYEDALNKVREKVVINFFEEYAGRKTIDYLERLQLHMLRTGQEKAFEKLYELISEKFKHRVSLKNKL